MARKHHDPVAWQQAIALVKAVYAASERFPASEKYGLTSQMRRAAISVPANIAEGVGRSGAKDRIRFFVIARGSLTELDTYAVLAKEIGYTSDLYEPNKIIDQLFGPIGGLINAERRKGGSA
jgi:four helix bundle protein